MKLVDLLQGVRFRAVHAEHDRDIDDVTADSRFVVPDALFVAIPGTQRDGAAFIPEAIQRGCAAVVGVSHAREVVEAQPGAERVAFIEVDDPREALAQIAANLHGHPATKLSLVGVTGTSGKTTTTRMLEAIFDAGSEPVGLIGTIEYRAGTERLVADRTTPDATVLQEWFARMVEARVRHAVMEVSSHALALKRTHGIEFAAAVFTNLSREHFDFHRDFEDYFAAKKMLFDQIDRSRQTAVVNVDDAYGRRLVDELGSAALTFGRDASADIHPLPGFEINVDGLHGAVATPLGDIRMDSVLLGLPNLYNWLAAIGAAISVGIPREQIEAGVRNLQSVRGRFERIVVPDVESAPTVIVDYAHKPDALDKLLRAVREIAGKRRVCIVFGCGGDRDRGKRAEMGEIAARLADEVIVTSDNPRSEDPQSIIDEIVSGVGSAGCFTTPDRREAIERAISLAQSDDVIVIAGKGHETYQVIGDEVVHFDDREEAEVVLRNRTSKQGS
jgi:UDP-N-acetylmuramoyl-L-alanyl-D-glutamate--2,6-diaminopimelate ligase